MIYIKNKRDLKYAYSMLSFFKGINDLCETTEGQETVKELKHDIRSCYRRMEKESSRYIVHSDGIDGYVVLFCLGISDDVSKSEANEYFMNNEYIEPYYSAFDCTGKPFTSWYKLCKRRGQWWAYHSISYDV